MLNEKLGGLLHSTQRKRFKKLYFKASYRSKTHYLLFEIINKYDVRIFN